MRSGPRHAAPLARRIAPGLLGVLAAAWTGTAVAADPDEAPEDGDGATLLRASTAEPAFELRPWRGLEARFGRDLTWARWMMAGSAPPPGDEEEHRAAPWLSLANFHDELALLRPAAGESAVSAIGSMVTAGLPVLGVWRDGKLRQRHVVRGYYRGRGIALAWRIEF